MDEDYDPMTLLHRLACGVHEQRSFAGTGRRRVANSAIALGE